MIDKLAFGCFGLLAVLKIAGLTPVSWWLVFSPIFVWLGFLSIVAIIAMIVAASKG